MSKVFKLIKEPYKVIKESKSEFILWFIFTIITGQLGIIANLLVRSFSNGTSLIQSIAIDFSNGSFYTFSIALVASILGMILINILGSKILEFRTLKIFTVVVSVFYLFITGIIYASVQSRITEDLKRFGGTFDFSQIIAYLLAMFLASYGYCILRLQSSSLNFDGINDPLFVEQDNKRVEKMISDGNSIERDQNGVEL